MGAAAGLPDGFAFAVVIHDAARGNVDHQGKAVHAAARGSCPPVPARDTALAMRMLDPRADGTLEHYDDLRGLDRYEARKRVVEQITAEGLAVMVPEGDPRVSGGKKVPDQVRNMGESPDVPGEDPGPLFPAISTRSRIKSGTEGCGAISLVQ